MSEITRLLREAEKDKVALEELYRRINNELVALARGKRRRDRYDPLMETMDLVNQAFLRLSAVIPAGVRDRAHLFRLFAQAMERALCDQARYRLAVKRGGARGSFELREDDWMTDEQAHQVLLAQEVLDEIEARWPLDARIFRESFFCGKSVQTILCDLALDPETAGFDEARVKAALKFVSALVQHHLQDRGETPE
jgi:RNA polymerase sigma factor (TIGR02999 family)